MTDVQKQIAKEAEVKEAKKGRICEWCGKPIPEHRNLLAKYCSNRCNQAQLSKRAGDRDKLKRARARAMKAEVVACAYINCETMFLKEKDNKKFCSRDCQRKEGDRNRRIRHKELRDNRSKSNLNPKWLVRGEITYSGYKQKGGNKDD